MPQNSDFVNRENQENNDRTTFLMEDDDLDSAETYSYENLTAQAEGYYNGQVKFSLDDIADARSSPFRTKTKKKITRLGDFLFGAVDGT